MRYLCCYCAKLSVGLLLLVSGLSEAAVTISASGSGVQKGQSLSFTASTDETDTVLGVTFSYEGTTATDYDDSPPYQASRSFDWATQENLLVTAAFDFENIDDQSGTTEVDVVDIVLTGNPSPVFSTFLIYRGYTQPSGIAVSTWDWNFSNATVGTGGVTFTDTINSDSTSIWNGRMVASGEIEVSATLLGISCSKTLNVDVQARTTSATIPASCIEDNEPGWGLNPDDFANVKLGRIQDRNSNLERYFVPQSPAGDWSDGLVASQITTGPNTGYWYISSHSLEIDRETLINRWLKSDSGPQPDAPESIYSFNNGSSGCLTGSMADYIQAIKNHEYRGTSSQPEPKGHYILMEQSLAAINNDLVNVLLNTKGLTESAVIQSANDSIEPYEISLRSSSADGEWAYTNGSNWGGTGSLGTGQITYYEDTIDDWVPGCTFGPERF